MNHSAERRRHFASAACLAGGTRNPLLLDAFASVARERFIGPAPWRICTLLTETLVVGTGDPTEVLHDFVIVDADGTAHFKPSFLATLLDAASPQHGDHSVVIGDDCLYVSALLHHLTGIQPICVNSGSGMDSQAQAIAACQDADVVILLAGCSQPPLTLMNSLAPNARMVLPMLGNQGTALCFRFIKPMRQSAPWAATPLVMHDVAPWLPHWDTNEAALLDAMSLYLPLIDQLHCSARYGIDIALSGENWCLTMDNQASPAEFPINEHTPTSESADA